MSAAAVEVVDLVKRYGPRPVVDGLSLRVERGSVTAVLGPNGAGKTTTIETCEGYRRPDSGTVRVLGLDPVRDSAELKARVGVMLQGGGIPNAIRPQEALEHAAALYADPLPPGLLVERLGLGGSLRTPYKRLSGGQQQRLSLALALVGRPELVFLDEPSAGLDPHARGVIGDLVIELRRAGVTVVLTTHLIDEAERLADEVVIIDTGRVVASGSPAELTAGGAQTRLTFSARPGLPLEALRSALPLGLTVTEEPAGAYRVDGPLTPAALVAVTGWCAALDVMPVGLSVSRRTLEDVFFEITGRELRA
ncbi:ABC-2 type transport system ATP-binding protein [Motilibacter peucedani]|uniref:ABC-2 type transport system ATP-binding protein n=1 Tax=Motilibacter peucedani TaxID=598650 RepID=A0A420XV71_9ACTN|nr:ABC transporter ATP-binding protein [Motilibacter peucedani]RKS84196.1 ABC-2 type transport system ATP-binding protein [Motilibacter peucedani]